MDGEKSELVAKVPQVTFLFWVVKILATTLGETAGDAVTMSWLGETTPEAKGTGYLIGTGIFAVIFVVAVLAQIKAKKFHPFLYWLTIVATTTVGTTLADYCTRSLGIGYTGGSTILLICVIASLLIWRWSTGSISIETVSTPKVEIFYLSFLPQFIPAGVQVWSFSILLALIHATEGVIWFLLLTNATELISTWLRQRRIVMALDSAMGAIFIGFGLKPAFDKAR